MTNTQRSTITRIAANPVARAVIVIAVGVVLAYAGFGAIAFIAAGAMAFVALNLIAGRGRVQDQPPSPARPPFAAWVYYPQDTLLGEFVGRRDGLYYFHAHGVKGAQDESCRCANPVHSSPFGIIKAPSH